MAGDSTSTASFEFIELSEYLLRVWSWTEGVLVSAGPHSRTLARPAPHITCAWPEASPMHPPSMPSAAHHRQPARMLHPHAQLRLCAPQEGRRRPLLWPLFSPPFPCLHGPKRVGTLSE